MRRLPPPPPAPPASPDVLSKRRIHIPPIDFDTPTGDPMTPVRRGLGDSRRPHPAKGKPMTDELETLEAIKTAVADDNDPNHLREMKQEVDSLRQTLENRINTLEATA